MINKPNDKITLKPKEENNETENIYKDKEIIVFDFSEEETEQDITVSFTVYNNSNRTIENTALFLDYYDNSKKTYTAEFAIDSLKPGEELEIKDEKIVFLYDKLTDRKFRFSDVNEVPRTTKEEYLKEYKTLDANKIKASSSEEDE